MGCRSWGVLLGIMASKLGRTPWHHGVKASMLPACFDGSHVCVQGRGVLCVASPYFERRGVSELHVEANSEGAWDSWGSSWDSECEDCLTINYEHALSRSGSRPAVHTCRDEAEVQSMRVP